MYKHIHVWRLRHISENAYIVILSVVVGLLSGLAAVALKTVVHEVSRMWLRIAGDSVDWLRLIYPAAGILLTILLVRYVLRNNIGHGIPNVLYAISRKKSILPFQNTYASLLASTLTVSFGGSVGLEAPIASTGSAIGSCMGQLCRLQTKQIKLLLGCGAAGAIAGIFKAPLAGILFVVEVYLFDLNKTTAIPLLLSSISATIVSYFLMGRDVQFAFVVADTFHLGQIPFYIALGVFCALNSIYFLRMTDWIESWYHRHDNILFRILVGGVVLGVLVFLFPPLFGEGYGVLTALLNGDKPSLYNEGMALPGNAVTTLVALVMLILLKPVATATTIGSGGVGGTFGPSLVMGGLSGFFVAYLCNAVGLPPQSTANFALVGMAAVMTGVMHAPLMATFLIAEITGGYALMAPLLIGVAVTYLCVNPFEKYSIYARKLAQHGDLMTHDKDSSAWQLMQMDKLIEKHFVTVHKGDTLQQLIKAIEVSHRNIFPVLDCDNKFVGVIHLDDVRHIIFKPECYDKYHVEDLVHAITDGDIVHVEDPLVVALKKFQGGSDRYNLIVTNKEGDYIGVLSRANTFSAYRKFISQTSDE